ncbi:hypothetical protein [Ruegeria profundi]|uniref:hypothetical protein n=1 Tax=Ruegeria profundi TaxID=1685378 RepID=UPI003C7B22B9
MDDSTQAFTKNPPSKPNGDASQQSGEYADAIREIAAAFVEIGFGSSPTKLVLQAANDNKPIQQAVDNYMTQKSGEGI